MSLDCDPKDNIQASQNKFQAEQQVRIPELERLNLLEREKLLQDKRTFFAKKEKAKKCNPLAALAAGLLLQKLCRCPVCSPLNVVKDKVAGKNYFRIPFTNFRIPRWDHLFDKTRTFDANRRQGEKCGSCGGTKQIPDPNDDSARYKQASQMLSDKAEQIMEAEAKLGLGGTRTTIIQGSDMLFVGLGFNNNKSYEVVPQGAIAPSMRGGKIPQQNATRVNAVVGKQASLGWPQQVGNYTIKCANKFNLLAGAGGITIATPGTLTFSAGSLKLVSPQLSLGSSTGPLVLEGDSVNIMGKAVSITPTGGELFVRGNINNTGNITTQGHAHFESVSFVKASMVGTTKSTYNSTANPDVVNTQPATWSYKAAAAALLDLQTYYQHILSDSKTSAFRLLSPKENQNIADRITTIGKLMIPWEILPTGFLLPGTPITVAGTCPCNYGGIAGGVITGAIVAPVPLFNFPHIHGIPEMQHHHDVVVPDMDFTSASPAALRNKVMNGAQESGMPADPVKDTRTRLKEIVRTTIEFTNAVVAEGTKLIAKITRLVG